MRVIDPHACDNRNRAPPANRLIQAQTSKGADIAIAVRVERQKKIDRPTIHSFNAQRHGSITPARPNWPSHSRLASSHAYRWRSVSLPALGRLLGLVLLGLGLFPADVMPSEMGLVDCEDNEVPAAEKRELLFKQAVICARLGKPHRAIALFSILIKGDPTDPDVYLSRGNAQASIGEVGLAISDLSTAINLEHDLVEAWYNRGTVFAQMGRFERAISDLTEAIRLRPDFARAYCNRGFARSHLGQYDEALTDYSKAIEQDGQLTYCYFFRGDLYLTAGDFQKAVDDFTKALDQKPSDAVALSRRGQAYEALGQINRALADFRAALQLSPKLEGAREGVERLEGLTKE